VGDMPVFNRKMLDVGEVAVELGGTRTEHVLVASLRHIVEVEITVAARRVRRAEDLEHASLVEGDIAAAWGLALRHVRAGRPAAARQSYERQAELLRERIGAWIGDATVGDGAEAAPA
jgi:hypothetical protein